MPNPKANLLLHPVRMRIVVEMINHPMTTQQLVTAMPDVAQATLYRHIKLLQDGGIITVTQETPVNGAIERTYRLVEGASRLSPEDMQEVTKEEHLLYFNTFVASLMETFGQYVHRTEPEQIATAGMSYNRATIHLNDTERAQFTEEIMTLLSKYIGLTPDTNRKRYTLASIVIPDERGDSE